MFLVVCAFKYHKVLKASRPGMIVNPVMIPAATIIQTMPNNGVQQQQQQQPVYIITNNPQQANQAVPMFANVQLPANAINAADGAPVIMAGNPPAYTQTDAKVNLATQ